MNKFGHLVWFILTVVALGFGFWSAQSGFVQIDGASEQSDEPEVLYWVAPMDDNYRRDKPGKSPMGMDLVPVYADKEVEEEPEVLYWVAPMDDGYRRDKPGKSPMGMDLVPVYASVDDSDEGVITISPQVVNSIGVRSEPVYVGPLKDEIEAVGTISLDQSQLYHVYPRVEGWVEQLYVDAVGDYVNKDQPLFSFYSPTLVHEQEEYLTILRRSRNVKNGAVQAKTLLKGAETRLLALGISKRQIDEVSKTGKVAQYVMIYARAAGFVTFLHLREGQYIKPSDKLLTVADTSSVWVMVELFERYANDVSSGQMGRLSVSALGQRIWQAEVKHIHPFLIADTRTLRLRLQVDNSDGQLKPNMFAKIMLNRNIAEQVIAVPSQALIRTGRQDRVVLALGEGQFRSVAVDVGREISGFVEITKGLAVDDKVVTSAHFLLDSESSTQSDFSRMTVEDRNAEISHSMHSTPEIEPENQSVDHSHHGGHH